MIGYFLLLTVFLFLLAAPVSAVCPACTLAVGAGVGLSRWLGIDDTVSGLWIGGLILSSGLWLASWLRRKKIYFPNLRLISAFLFYLLVIPGLYLSGIIGHTFNTLWGVDKLLLGILLGSLLFLGSLGLDQYLRLGNHGKGRIDYQKVILPICFLSLASLIFYFLTK